MRITYRYSNNKDYWDKRWANTPVDSPMKNTTKYPLKFTELAISGDKSGKILEAGCGAGEFLSTIILEGYNISGFDFIPDVIKKLSEDDDTLKVKVGDITSLDYESNTFKYVLAFGLYHNLDLEKIKKALKETKSNNGKRWFSLCLF